MADSASLLKWGLIAGGGYLLYRAYAGSTSSAPLSFTDLVSAVRAQMPATPASSPASGNSSSMDNQVIKAAAGADSAATQQQKIIAAAGGDASKALTVSQWNWYWGNVYNSPQTATFLGDDGSPMTAAAYMALRVQKGFSGLDRNSINPASAALPVPMMIGRAADGRPFVFAIGPRPGQASARANYLPASASMRPRPTFLFRPRIARVG